MDNRPKTHYAALVIIPPEPVWEPIQRIRRQHDPQVRRWMPHVTVLFPFLPESWFNQVAERIEAVCQGHAPFRVTCSQFGFFEHNPTSATVWLDCDPHEPIANLQADLEGEFPECTDVSQFAGGFTPHLSVGRFPGADAAQAALREFQFAWMPLEFDVAAVHLISRSGEPDDPFHVRKTIPLRVV